MKTIYKYPLADSGLLNLPTGAKIVHCDVQRDIPTLWIEVDTVAELEERRFTVYGTGHPIGDNATHVGTYFDGPFVWHVYEIK